MQVVPFKWHWHGNLGDISRNKERNTVTIVNLSTSTVLQRFCWRDNDVFCL